MVTRSHYVYKYTFNVTSSDAHTLTYAPYKPFYSEHIGFVSRSLHSLTGRSEIQFILSAHSVSRYTYMLFFLFYRRHHRIRIHIHTLTHKYVFAAAVAAMCSRVLYTHIHQPHSVQQRPGPKCYVATLPSPLDRPVLVRTLGGNVDSTPSLSLSFLNGPLGISHTIYIYISIKYIVQDNNNVFIETESCPA